MPRPQPRPGFQGVCHHVRCLRRRQLFDEVPLKFLAADVEHPFQFLVTRIDHHLAPSQDRRGFLPRTRIVRLVGANDRAGETVIVSGFAALRNAAVDKSNPDRRT